MQMKLKRKMTGEGRKLPGAVATLAAADEAGVC